MGGLGGAWEVEGNEEFTKLVVEACDEVGLEVVSKVSRG